MFSFRVNSVRKINAQLAWIPDTFTLLSWGCLAPGRPMMDFHTWQEEKSHLGVWLF